MFLSGVVLCAALAAVDGSVPDGGVPVDSPGDAGVAWDGGFDPGVPASWALSAKLPRGSAARTALVKDLTAKGGGAGETALTADEAEAFFDDPPHSSSTATRPCRSSRPRW